MSTGLNVLTTPQAELQIAFDLMEGDGFYNYTMSAKPGGHSYEFSLIGAIDRMNKHRQMVNDITNITGDYGDLKNDPEDWEWWKEQYSPDDIISGAIYGNGGWNRYFLKGDGTILFSKMHATTRRAVQDAADLGFEIF